MTWNGVEHIDWCSDKVLTKNSSLFFLLSCWELSIADKCRLHTRPGSQQLGQVLIDCAKLCINNRTDSTWWIRGRYGAFYASQNNCCIRCRSCPSNPSTLLSHSYFWNRVHWCKILAGRRLELVPESSWLLVYSPVLNRSKTSPKCNLYSCYFQKWLQTCMALAFENKNCFLDKSGFRSDHTSLLG